MIPAQVTCSLLPGQSAHVNRSFQPRSPICRTTGAGCGVGERNRILLASDSAMTGTKHSEPRGEAGHRASPRRAHRTPDLLQVRGTSTERSSSWRRLAGFMLLENIPSGPATVEGRIILLLGPCTVGGTEGSLESLAPGGPTHGITCLIRELEWEGPFPRNCEGF